MSVHDVLRSASEQGVLFYLKDNKLAYRVKKGALSSELISKIKDFKSEIIDFLKSRTEDDNLLILPSVKLADRSCVLPLSFSQQRLWFIDQLEQGSLKYNLTGNFLLEGDLNITAFRQSLQSLIERHEILRTRYCSLKGEIQQIIDTEFELPLERHDLSNERDFDKSKLLESLIKIESEMGFNLEQDLMLRVCLVKIDKTKHFVLYTLHHIAGDGWSRGILQAELGTLYKAYCKKQPNPLKPLKIQYADYALWQRQWLQGDVLEKSLDYWQNQLADLPLVHSLPLDKDRPALQRSRGNLHRVLVNKSLSEQIRSFNQSNATTLFMFMHTALGLLLSRLSGEKDIVLGSAITGRSHQDIEGLIGLFINDLVLRLKLDKNVTFSQLIQQHKKTILDAYSYQHIPFEMLVEKLNPHRSMSHSPLYQIKLDIQNNKQTKLELEDIKLVDLRESTKTLEVRATENDTEHNIKHDLYISVVEQSEGLSISWRYNTDLFLSTTIERLADQFNVLLKSIVTTPYEKIQQLDILTLDSKERLLAASKGVEAVYPQGMCLQELFEAQVVNSPEAVAIDFEGENFTYKQLNEKSNQLAHYLVDKGIEPDSVTALCMERSPEMIVGILAVLKAGGAYTPLDPKIPQSRIDTILDDCDCQWLLTQDELLSELTFGNRRTLPIGGALCESLISSYPKINLPKTELLLNSRHLAYVIYTSGSTGIPKGVSVEHDGLIKYCKYAQEIYYDKALSGSVVATSYSFDLTVPSLFVPLISGGTVKLLSESNELESLANLLLETEKSFLLRLTPSHLKGLMFLFESSLINYKACDKCSHVFVIGGEILSSSIASSIQRLFPKAKLFNHYGPTESIVGCSLYPIEDTQCLSEYKNCPIGCPMSHTQLLVLNEELQLTPVGVAGELFIGGTGLAREYLNNSFATNEKFIGNPFSSNDERLYRTGDLVRWIPDANGNPANLEFIGRIDNQVKLRGLRIELGDIEHALLNIEGVQAAAVLVSSEEDADNRRLISYLVVNEQIARQLMNAKNEDETTYIQTKESLIFEYREILSHTLPDYMVPQIYLFIDELPLNINGKLDKSLLPKPQEADLLKTFYLAPRCEMEREICELWQEVLKIEQLGINDDFFLLGGHSLLATRLINLLSEKFNTELPLRLLFDSPTVAGVADYLRENETTNRKLTIESVSRSVPLELSFAQQRLWFLDQFSEGSDQYNVSGSYPLHGEFVYSAFEFAVKGLLERHEILRTNIKESSGNVSQIIRDTFSLPICTHDLSDLNDKDKQEKLQYLTHAESKKLFDLSRDLMFRVTVFKLDCNLHLIYYTTHHIASDGWSRSILQRELNTLYHSFVNKQENPLKPLKIQYADYAAWQRDRLKGDILENQIDYWRNQLENIPTVHSLPLDKARPLKQGFSGSKCRQLLPSLTGQKIKSFCENGGVTLFMFLQTAFALLLSRFSNETDIVVASPVAGRNHHDIEGLIGFFTNTLVLRTNFSKQMTFNELLVENKSMILDAYANQDVPFEMLVEELQPERSMSHSPLAQILFTLQNNETYAIEKKESVTPLATSNSKDPARLVFTKSRSIKFELELSVMETEKSLVIDWLFSDALFTESKISTMANSFNVLLNSILESSTSDDNFDSYIHDLELLTPQSRFQQLEDWNATECNYPDEESIQSLFEQQVLKSPDSIALVFDSEVCGASQLTYAELNDRANLLAHRLISMGVSPESKVGVCAERSLELVIALLAILKSGGAYVPLEPQMPHRRLAYQIQDSEIEVLLISSSKSISETVAKALEETLEIGSDSKPVTILKLNSGIRKNNFDKNCVQTLNPSIQISKTQLAYIIYTSGSTGEPKGVAIDHKAIVNRIDWMQEHYCLTRQDKILQKTPYNFDVSVWEFFWPLLTGACLVVAKPEGHKDVDYLQRSIEKNYISILHFVPSMLNVFLSSGVGTGCKSVRQFICSGEALSKELEAQFFNIYRKSKLENLYGPTEAAIDVSSWRCERDSQLNYVPIGRPIQNIQLYIVDRMMQPLPVGCIGELLIGGVGLSRGYINKAGLTARSFIPNNFGSKPGSRLYRSGDLARFSPDGSIEYLGRIDHQVKVRGMRIELGEIEAVLTRHSSVKDTIVIASKVTEEENGLLCYVVCHDQDKRDKELIESFKKHLGAELPEYAVPSHYKLLERFPVTKNGKLDRVALPKLDEFDLALTTYTAPRTELESTLCDMWKDTLKVKRVGIYDNFFLLGGHSLLATRLVSSIRQNLKIELPIRALFESSDVASLAQLIEKGNDRVIVPPVTLAPRNVALPLSYAQQRLWFVDQLGEGSVEYNMPGRYLLSGEFHETAFKNALKCILNRHEVLRTHFCKVKEEPVQIIVDKFELPYKLHDLSDLDPLQKQKLVSEYIVKQAKHPFDLSGDLMLRVRILKLSHREHLVLYTMHHIAGDGWSLAIFKRELEHLYKEFSNGTSDQLLPLKVQYADYALWQRRWLSGEVLENQLKYWKKQLAGIPPVHSLPLDKRRPAKQSFTGNAFTQRIKPEVCSQVKSLCQQHGVSLFMFLETAFTILLSRYSREKDIVVGSPIAGRTHKDLEDMIGFFVNSLVLRTDLSGNPTFSQLLKKNKNSILEAYAHQHLPFEMLVEEIRPQRDMSFNSLFQILFVVQNNEAKEASEQIAIRSLDHDSLFDLRNVNIRFDLALHVTETDNDLLIRWSYRDSLFNDETISKMALNFGTLLDSIIEGMSLRENEPFIEQLNLLSSSERSTLLNEWQGPSINHSNDKCIHQLFEQQVILNPNSVAVVYQDRELTYKELNQRSNQLAHRLIELGAIPDSMVALNVNRSFETMIGLIGILKSGAGYVPLDPEYPQSRLDFMLNDCGAAIVVSQSALTTNLDFGERKLVCLDSRNELDILERHSVDNPEIIQPKLKSSNLAYVIYTSGSTGLPKGVMINHKSVCNFLNCAKRLFLSDDIKGAVVSSPLSFDATVQSLFLPLCVGKYVELLPDDDLLFENLTDYLIDDDVSMLFKITPTHLKALSSLSVVAKNSQAKHVIVVAGEQLTKETLEPWVKERLPNTRFINEYGPTEATVGSCTFEVTDSFDFRSIGQGVPIGKPFDNFRFYVLDEHLELLPIGATGELYIAGEGLAREYLNQRDMTNQHFILDKYSPYDNSKMYRTGDLVRWLPDGNIEFVGRIDDQVKIRGFRIELGEVEGVLSSQKALNDSAVIVNQKEGDSQLIAYVCPSRQYLDESARRFNSEHLEQWTLVNDDKYGDTSNNIEEVEQNFFGWNSSYTGKPIDEHEMLEWLNGTMERISQLKPKRIMEIGCGQGLFLFRYAEMCEEVYASDISAVALKGVQAEVSKRGWNHVELEQGDALSIDHLAGKNFDTIVINSVVQYFPNQIYLEQVIKKVLACIKPGGNILIGDVRNLDLFSAHLVALEKNNLNQATPSGQISNRVQRRMQQEPELLISPSFFAQLKHKFEEILDIDILVKRGIGENELLRYRYDIVIHKKNDQCEIEKESTINSFEWTKFSNLEDSKALIASNKATYFGLYGVPNFRVNEDVILSKGLSEWKNERLIYPPSSIGKLSKKSVEQICLLETLLTDAEALGYQCEMTWSQDSLDKLDIVFSSCSLPSVRAKSGYSNNYLTNHPQLVSVGQELSAKLKRELSASLPDYMVPAVYIALEHLPMTPSGKVDRKALPLPEEDDLEKNTYVAARNTVEEKLTELWLKLLNLEQVGVNDNFFALGGHSLLATRLISLIRQSFRVELPLRTLFDSPTIAELSKRIEQESEEHILPPLTKVDRTKSIPLSFAQQRLWFIEQLEGSSSQYNMPGRYLVQGEFHTNEFKMSINSLLMRHEVLRTCFRSVNGEVSQIILNNFELPYEFHDLTDLYNENAINDIEKIIDAEANRVFDLTNDLMLRVCVLKLSEELHIVLYTTHHIASDGWSVGVLRNELSALYSAYCEDREPQLPQLDYQYADYAVWQKSWLNDELLDSTLTYWRKQLAGIPPLHSVPLDHERPSKQTFNGQVFRQELDASVTNKIRSLCKSHEVTLFMFMQSAFAVLLSRYSNQTDIVMGTPVAGRNHSDLEPLIGFFINTLVLRTDLSTNPDFAQLLAENKDVILDAYSNQHLPFEMLVDELQPERNMSYNPVVQILFAVQNTERGLLELNAPEKNIKEAQSKSKFKNNNIKFDLELNIHEHTEQLSISWGFNIALFDQHSITSMAKNFGVLLSSIIESLTGKLKMEGDQKLDKYPQEVLKASVPEKDFYNEMSEVEEACLKSDYKYWSEILDGIPYGFAIPTDRDRANNHISQLSDYYGLIPRKLAIKIQGFSRKQGLSYQAILLTAFATLMARYSGKKQVAIVSPVKRSEEVRNFDNSSLSNLIVRIELSDDPSFVNLAHRVSETVQQGLKHSSFSYEAIFDKEKSRKHPGFKVLFDMRKNTRETARPTLSSSDKDNPSNNKREKSNQAEYNSNLKNFDLSLILSEGMAGTSVKICFDSKLFNKRTIEILAVRFLGLLETIITSPSSDVSMLLLPEQRVSRLKIFDNLEKDTLTHITCQSDRNMKSLCVQDLFESNCRENPNTVVFEGFEDTFESVDLRSNKVANFLNRNGVRHSSKVGILLTEPVEVLTAILGVLKLGGCYALLSPEFPRLKLAGMIDHSGVDFVISNPEVSVFPDAKALTGDSAQIYGANRLVSLIELGDNQDIWHCSSKKPVKQHSSLCIAYLYCTVSEVGEPLWVSVNHESLCKLIASNESVLTYQDNKINWLARSTNKQNYNWSRLPLKASDYLSDTVQQSKEEFSYQVDIKKRRLGVCSNEYLLSAEYYIISKDMQLVPTGGVGELYLSWDGYSITDTKCYGSIINQLVPNPFTNKNGTLLYRTGHLARRLRDGSVQLLDITKTFQEKHLDIYEDKIYSNVIEVLDVAVDSLVIDEKVSVGSQKTILVSTNGSKDSVSDMEELYEKLIFHTRHQTRLLPLPIDLIAVGKIPRTQQGILDLNAISHLLRENKVNVTYVPPRNEIERTLCLIWETTLQVNEVGINDNFFAIGGHSLLATRLVSAIRKELSTELPLSVLFESPTIAELADGIKMFKDITAREKLEAISNNENLVEEGEF